VTAAQSKTLKIPATFEQQLDALNALTFGNSIDFRYWTDSKRWTVHIDDVDVSTGWTITGLKGDGETPEDAVANVWERVIKLSPWSKDDNQEKYLVLETTERRRHIIWADFMWHDIPVNVS